MALFKKISVKFSLKNSLKKSASNLNLFYISNHLKKVVNRYESIWTGKF